VIKKRARKKRKRKERRRVIEFKRTGAGLLFEHGGKKYFGSYDLTIEAKDRIDEHTCSDLVEPTK
jgi:hypothetical protein